MTPPYPHNKKIAPEYVFTRNLYTIDFGFLGFRDFSLKYPLPEQKMGPAYKNGTNPKLFFVILAGT